MDAEHKKELKYMSYHMFLGCILISINVYFFIFVHFRADLSPNIALALVTIPFAINEIRKVMMYEKPIKINIDQIKI